MRGAIYVQHRAQIEGRVSQQIVCVDTMLAPFNRPSPMRDCLRYRSGDVCAIHLGGRFAAFLAAASAAAWAAFSSFVSLSRGIVFAFSYAADVDEGMTVDGALKSTPSSASCATAVSASMSRPASATPMASTSFTNSLARALATRM